MNKNSSFKNRRYVVSSTSSKFQKKADSPNISESGFFDFYSPVLSKDFLELPQNLKERRAWYRFFYTFNEMVRRAIDLHSELPLSKIRLTPPKCADYDKAQYIQTFFQNMCDRLKLFKKLLAISHEYYLMGLCYVFLEDGNEKGAKNNPLLSIDEELQMPEEAMNLRKKYDKLPDYQGWERLQILPPDMVKISRWQFSDKVRAELLIPTDSRNLLKDLRFNPHMQDETEKMLEDVPSEIREKLETSEPIVFDTDPYSGSHLVEILRKTENYEESGSSILDACLRSLLLLDKYRQAQSIIASRHMTPIRVVSAAKASLDDIEYLREQVDAALVDPDYSIIANYDITWNEMGSDNRILHLADEYAELEKKLTCGLGVTIGLLTGESTYGGERVSLEIINTQYMLFREVIQDFVESHIFKPIALKKGFWEYDKFGNKTLLYPKLSFTRLAIRDNDAIFGQLFDLYQKGSISLSYILDLLGIDPTAVREEMEKDVFTVNDSRFNDVINSAATTVGPMLAEQTDLMAKVAEYLKLKVKAESTEEERFK